MVPNMIIKCLYDERVANEIARRVTNMVTECVI